MKELSIEQKARAYDETLERAKQLLATSVVFDRFTIERIFPELKENEDERVRKALINYLITDEDNGVSKIGQIPIDNVIAWLEKQGEQNINVQISPSEYVNDMEGNGCYLKNATQTSTWSKKEEKVDNQNCIKSADDIKPKFKVGDWISNDMCDAHIASIEDGMYYFDEGDGLSIVFVDEHYHLWTIEDAMDGDVLACENGWTCIFKTLNSDNISFSSYCFMDNTGWFCETGSESHTLEKAFIKAYNGEIYPATKEQRAQLFQKMKEAGYEWDSQKKELKEIDTYCQENCKGFQETGRCFCDGECKAKREAESIDKVEPKFHEGNWVVNKLGDSWHIDSFDKKNYQLSDGKGNHNYFPISNQNEMHLWTIQDAKEGDVLTWDDTSCVVLFKNIKNSKCFINDISFEIGTSHYIEDCHPATKEQRDTLFAKMKEAEYIFDFKNKELKKIKNEIEIPFGAKDSELQQATYYIPKGFYAEIKDDKVVIKKGEKLTAWSEDDEHRVKDAIYFLDTAKKHYASAVELDACIDWIKSLEDRVQPKQEWSAEDNSVLKDIKVAVASYWDEDTENIILDWLKSLKQRIGG